MPRKLKHDLDISELSRDYLTGASINQLSKKHECSRRTIERRLIAHGVVLRSISEANKRHSDSLSEEEKKRKTEAAHIAARGLKHDIKSLESRALSREKNPTLSKYEIMLCEELKSRGVNFIPQKAYSKYNVDFALLDHKIIIEIFGGWHDSEKAIKSFENKSELLFNDGWDIVVCWSAGVFDPKRVCDYAVNLDTGNKGRHYVIRGNARPSKIGLNKINFQLS